MNRKNATIKNKSLQLPDNWRGWDNTDVSIVQGEDTLIIRKKTNRSTGALSQLRSSLRAAGKTIEEDDITDAINAARNEPSG